MSSFATALNWYHKKIGAYDKELWEKSVDQRILRGVCAIPKKTTRIKTELIDVDLVRGSAFAKAKPQHSWIAASISGLKRVFLLPCFYSWWKLQTNTLVSCALVILYVLQIIAMYLYFSSGDKEFLDVPVSEIIAPAAMSLILGIVHSQIVATFAIKKSRKHVTRRDKRRKIKCRRVKKSNNYDQESKSSPDSASDERQEDHFDQTGNEESNNPDWGSCGCKKFYKTGQQLRFSLEDHSRTGCSVEDCDSDFVEPPEECANSVNLDSPIPKTSFIQKGHSPNKSSSVLKSSDCQYISDCTSASIEPTTIHSNNHSVMDSNPSYQSSAVENTCKCNSDEEFFVARKQSEHCKNHLLTMKNTCSASKLLSKKPSLSSRRYSDGTTTYRKSKWLQTRFLSLQDHRRSSEDTLAGNMLSKRGAALKDDCAVSDAGTKFLKERDSTVGVPRTIKLPINIKSFSSSCESGAETTLPNTPSKPQTSDLEWPLITNTDCNSDSSDCSSQCSEGNVSDVSPSENPFACEIQEPSKKLSNVGCTGTDKVSCTIWEHNECKKADLTALDISSAIIQKVDSSQHSSEYLFSGVIFAVVLSLLPLLFRLKNGVAMHDIQDVTTDVLTLTIPSSEEMVKATDGLLDVVLGCGWRVKFVVLIVMLERFTLSLAYFFLLSVSEKTFKQRFLYAKHFCYLTSSRRAKRADLPHFRLNKVRNIKIWLSIRSYMKKLGPQRSVDVIVSIAFILEVCVVSFLCIQLLKETGQFADRLHYWELIFWTLTLGIYLLRFMVIGTKINKKYRNLSVLITEQINLYLHMEQKPHKKEELMLSNNVLKLAADLLKELESPFKISGLCANSYLYNITKVVVLSAFSAVLTDVLGFKLKLYKIKLK